MNYQFALVFFDVRNLGSELIMKDAEGISDILVLRNGSNLGMHIGMWAYAGGTQSNKTFFWDKKESTIIAIVANKFTRMKLAVEFGEVQWLFEWHDEWRNENDNKQINK